MQRQHLNYGLLLNLLVLAGLALAHPGPSAAAQTGQTEGPTVVLPTLVVEAESLKFDGWSKTASPHFVLYTDYGTDEAQSILLRLERVRNALDRLSGLPSVATRPIAFIYPSQRSDWNKLENFDRKASWTAHAVTWGADGNITVLELVRQGSLLAQLIVREDPHFGFNGVLGNDFCRAHNLPERMWFTLGVSLLTAYADVREDRVSFGRPTFREVNYSTHGAIPWEQFFSLSRMWPEDFHLSQIGTFYAQSSLSVRHLLANPDPARCAKLYSWLYYLSEGNAPTEAKFKEIFGLDWRAWTQAIMADRQLHFGLRTRTGVDISLSPAERAPPIRQAELRPVEMRELFLLAQIAGGAATHSADMLDHLLAKGIKTNDLRPLLASACIREGRREPALAILRTLCAEGGSNPRIYEEAARLLFEQAVPRITLTSQMGAELEEIRTLCHRAIALNPHSLVANDILAWSHVLDPRFGEEGIATLSQLAARQEAVHHTREIQTALALAAFRQGDIARAGQISRDLWSSPRWDNRAADVIQQIVAALPAPEGRE